MQTKMQTNTTNKIRHKTIAFSSPPTTFSEPTYTPAPSAGANLPTNDARLGHHLSTIDIHPTPQTVIQPQFNNDRLLKDITPVIYAPPEHTSPTRTTQHARIQRVPIADQDLPNWSAPVSSGVTITSGWGAARKYRNGIHKGVDIRAAIGTPIYAIADGKVTFIYHWQAGGKTSRDTAGNFIKIVHPNGISSEYMHLSEILVSQGEHITGGQLIGKSGDTGGARGSNPKAKPMGPHLHFQVRDKSGALIPPTPFVKMANAPDTTKQAEIDTATKPTQQAIDSSAADWRTSAVKRNIELASRLGWNSRIDEIVAYFQSLGYVPAQLTPGPELFAEAVKQFQSQHQPLKDDGILGPNTWQRIQTELSAKQTSMGMQKNKSIQSATGSQKSQQLAAQQPIDLRGLKGLERSMANIHNQYGDYLAQKAAELKIDVEDAAAFLKVESGGQGFSQQTGRMIIRFENHKFYALWGKQHGEQFLQHFQFNPNKHWTGHLFRADSKAEFTPVHSSQQQEWTVFEFARGLNENAALQSISMGVAQILGSNYGVVGYSSPKEMFDDMSTSLTGQVDGLFRFIARVKKGVIIKALQQKDYTTAARYYNGKGKEAAYGEALSSASDAYVRILNRVLTATQ